MNIRRVVEIECDNCHETRKTNDQDFRDAMESAAAAGWKLAWKGRALHFCCTWCGEDFEKTERENELQKGVRSKADGWG